MIADINLENYEAFYLDYLEGSLSNDQIFAFEAFLEKNPDLKLEDESLVYLSNESNQLSSFDISMMKQGVSFEVINQDNVEYAIVSKIENQLTPIESQKLNAFLSTNSAWAAEARLYEASKLPLVKEVFEHKAALKKEEKARIIPLWLYGSVAAAACFTLFFATKNTGVISGVSENPGQVASQRDTIHGGAKKAIILPVKKNGYEQESKNTSLNKNKKEIDKDKANSNNSLVKPGSFNKKNLLNSDPGRVFEANPGLQPIIIEQNQSNGTIANNSINTPVQDRKNNNQLPPVVLPQQIVETPINNDVASLDNNAMYNPIPQFTKTLTKKLGTNIEIQKSRDKSKKRFFIKIGKFEFSRKR